jgi:hypothetical protein
LCCIHPPSPHESPCESRGGPVVVPVHPIIGLHHTSFCHRRFEWSNTSPIVGPHRTAPLFCTPQRRRMTRNGVHCARAETPRHVRCMRYTPTTIHAVPHKPRSGPVVVSWAHPGISNTRTASAPTALVVPEQSHSGPTLHKLGSNARPLTHCGMYQPHSGHLVVSLCKSSVWYMAATPRRIDIRAQ